MKPTKNKPIKVLQVIPTLAAGGISSVVMNWYRNINKEEVIFDFICFNDGPLRAEIERLGGQIFLLPTFRQSPVKHLKAIGSIFSKNSYDAIHVHNSFKNVVMLWRAKFAGIAIRVCHSHTAGLENKALLPVFKLLKKLMVSASTDLLACGHDAGRFLYANADFTVVNNAISVEKFSDAAVEPSILDKYELPKNKKIILHVGRFSTVKNHQFIIDLANDNSLNPEYHFVCVGEGPLKDDLYQQVLEKGLSERVTFLPANNDIHLLLKQSYIFIMPSLFEGISVALLEAQASGKVCLISDTIDMRSDIGLGLVEFLSLEKPASWVNEINNLSEKIVSNESIRKAFSVRKFDTPAVLKQLENTYQLCKK